MDSKHGLITQDALSRGGFKPPEIIQVLATSVTSITVGWISNYMAVAGYEIRVDGVSVFDVGNFLTYEVGDLGPGTGHSFEVRAYDTDGFYSAWSASVIGYADSLTGALEFLGEPVMFLSEAVAFDHTA